MLKIAIGDWFLARSEAFRILLDKFRNHKINTQKSFYMVKQKHNIYEQQINILHKRVRTVENILKTMQEEKPKVIKKNK